LRPLRQKLCVALPLCAAALLITCWLFGLADTGDPLVAKPHQFSFTRCAFTGGRSLMDGAVGAVVLDMRGDSLVFDQRTKPVWPQYTHAQAATFTDCLFANNSIAGPIGVGGGIRVFNGLLQLRRCAFLGNSAAVGGALLATGTAAVNISGCVFAGNRASNRGTAVAFNNRHFVDVRNTTIDLVDTEGPVPVAGCDSSGWFSFSFCRLLASAFGC
jgi:hypothetical protein